MDTGGLLGLVGQYKAELVGNVLILYVLTRLHALPGCNLAHKTLEGLRVFAVPTPQDIARVNPNLRGGKKKVAVPKGGDGKSEMNALEKVDLLGLQTLEVTPGMFEREAFFSYFESLLVMFFFAILSLCGGVIYHHFLPGKPELAMGHLILFVTFIASLFCVPVTLFQIGMGLLEVQWSFSMGICVFWASLAFTGMVPSSLLGMPVQQGLEAIREGLNSSKLMALPEAPPAGSGGDMFQVVSNLILSACAALIAASCFMPGLQLSQRVADMVAAPGYSWKGIILLEWLLGWTACILYPPSVPVGYGLRIGVVGGSLVAKALLFRAHMQVFLERPLRSIVPEELSQKKLDDDAMQRIISKFRSRPQVLALAAAQYAAPVLGAAALLLLPMTRARVVDGIGVDSAMSATEGVYNLRAGLVQIFSDAFYDGPLSYLLWCWLLWPAICNTGGVIYFVCVRTEGKGEQDGFRKKRRAWKKL